MHSHAEVLKSPSLKSYSHHLIQVITASGGVIGSRKQQGNFVFYTIDRVLHRPGGSILDVVHSSILLPKLDEAIKFAGLEEYLSGASDLHSLYYAGVLAPGDKLRLTGKRLKRPFK